MMVQRRLTESELILFGAAVGVIGDPVLREEVARRLRTALRSYAPQGTASVDWKNWFRLCRAEAEAVADEAPDPAAAIAEVPLTDR
jgi:hypothetical protein